jgi:hypothetical protein
LKKTMIGGHTAQCGVLLVVFAAGSLMAPPQATTPTKRTGTAAAAVKLLTPEEVEKVIGLKGIRLSPPQNDFDRDLTFVTQYKISALGLDASGDSFILFIKFLPVAPTEWNTMTGRLKSLNASHLSGVGDDAYEDRASLVMWFRKGKNIVMIQAALSLSDEKPYASPEQLRELAKIIASRL